MSSGAAPPGTPGDSSFFPVSNVFAAAGVPFNAASNTRWGGAIGAGFEFGFAPNWSVGVEYDHLFMGNPNIVFPPTNIAVGRADNIRQDVDIGLVRVNIVSVARSSQNSDRDRSVQR